MDGLIASAKIQLWNVVNELARIKPTPNLLRRTLQLTARTATKLTTAG